MANMKKNDPSSDPLVLITGASTGLGLRVAQFLIQKNYRLVLTARAESLHRFAVAGLSETDRIRLRPLDIMNDEQRKKLAGAMQIVWLYAARWRATDYGAKIDLSDLRA